MRPLTSIALLFFGPMGLAQYGPPQTAIQSEVGTVFGLATGDLNGDGLDDIAIAGGTPSNPGLGYISARFGLGGGTFGPSTTLGSATYYYPPLFCIVDINQDGIVDIKIGDGWLPGLGSGAFNTYQSGGFCPGNNMADLDGDGDLDMVANGYSQTPAIFWNDGVGNFTVGPNIGISSGSSPLTLYALARDVTGDGVIDIVIGGNNQQVGLYAGLGNGSYGSRQVIPTLAGDQRVVYGDMDGDGDFDIVRSGGYTNQGLVLKNNGAGVFAVSDTIIGYGNILGSWVADIDQDGDLDLSKASGASFTNLDQQWWLNDGTGNNWTYKSFGSGTAFQALADLDQDLLPDLVMGQNYLISWHEWSNADQWSPRVDLPGSIAGSHTLAGADFDLDGDADLASSSCENGEVYWTANNGDGTFGPKRVILTGVYCINRLLARDLNGDGADDLICESDASFKVLINNGAGATWTQSINSSIGGNYSELDIGDMDGDGDPDIVDQGGWWANDGSGSFTAIANSTWNSSTSSGRLKLGDMNNDGLVDVVCGHSVSIRTCINQGGGVYGSTNSIGSGHRIELADMDEDGDLDVVNINANISDVFICINNGSGGLVQQMVFDGPAPYSATAIAIDDINGDGHVDILHARSYGFDRTLTYLLGTGLGTVSPPVTFATVSCSIFNIMLPADLDGDLVNDLAYPVLNGITWHENLFFEATSVRCFLEGPYVAVEGMMRDDLRTHGLLPVQEPYSALGLPPDNAGAHLVVNTLTTVGANAIVDWVLVELRDAIIPSVVHARRCALLQRDGDVAGMDGISRLSFPSSPNNYFIAIRHRNHFGAMTANAMNLGSATLIIDFTSPGTLTYGVGARKNISGVSTLWAGNALLDGVLRYVGAGNDRDPILSSIGGSTPSATLVGYRPEDVNMDGTVKYVGAGNDRDPILVNIGGSTPTNTRTEQLP